MSEDGNTTQGTTEAAPAADPATAAAEHKAAIAAAEALLKAEGHEVLNSAAFHGVKTTAAEAAEAKYATAQATLEAVQAENKKLAEFKASQESQGQSVEEKHAAQRAEWQRQLDERQANLEELTAREAEANAKLARVQVQNKTAPLMHDANNLEMAQMWADKYVGERLSVEGDDLVWTDKAGTPHLGINAINQFNAWWAEDAQKHLRSGNTAGPPTSGGTSPAPTATTPEYKPLDRKTSTFQQRMDHAKAWELEHGMRAPHQGGNGQSVPKNTL